MSVESVLARVATLEQAIANPANLLATNAAGTGGTAAPAAPEPTQAGGSSFAQALQSANESQAGTATPTSTASTGVTPTGVASTAPAGLETGTPALGNASVGALAGTSGLAGTAGLASPTSTPGQQIVRIAESQLGQTEQPPGSNESPAIAMYRTATAGAIPGAPWCAYFASWAARQAGEPLGASGEGLGSVAQVWSWAQSTGRAIPNGPGVTPQPGDLIVFGDEHVGIVRDVLPNGDIQTIEGNYENKVAANVRTPTEATGYVNMN
jgi:CHAP domain